jgi:hypothetical protein
MRLWPRDRPKKIEIHLVNFITVIPTRTEQGISHIVPI